MEKPKKVKPFLLSVVTVRSLTEAARLLSCGSSLGSLQQQREQQHSNVTWRNLRNAASAQGWSHMAQPSRRRLGGVVSTSEIISRERRCLSVSFVENTLAYVYLTPTTNNKPVELHIPLLYNVVHDNKSKDQVSK